MLHSKPQEKDNGNKCAALRCVVNVEKVFVQTVQRFIVEITVLNGTISTLESNALRC